MQVKLNADVGFLNLDAFLFLGHPPGLYYILLNPFYPELRIEDGSNFQVK